MITVFTESVTGQLSFLVVSRIDSNISTCIAGPALSSHFSLSELVQNESDLDGHRCKSQ